MTDQSKPRETHRAKRLSSDVPAVTKAAGGVTRVNTNYGLRHPINALRVNALRVNALRVNALRGFQFGTHATGESQNAE
jgi:hypothetical protein